MTNVTLRSTENPMNRLVVPMSDWETFLEKTTRQDPLTALMISLRFHEVPDGLAGDFGPEDLTFVAVRLWQEGIDYRQKGILKKTREDIPEAFLKAFRDADGDMPDHEDEDGLILIPGFNPEDGCIFAALVTIEGTHKGEIGGMMRHTFAAMTSNDDVSAVLRVVTKKDVYPEPPEDLFELFTEIDNPEQYVDTDRIYVSSEFLEDLTAGPLRSFEAFYTFPCNPGSPDDWHIRVIVNIRQATYEEAKKQDLI